MSYSCRIVRPWEHHESYNKLAEWVSKQNPLDASFGEAYGISYINGKIYKSGVRFEHEEARVPDTLKV